MDIAELIAQGEGQRVEFKESLSEEKAAIESLVAFANANGGTVLFGVRDDGSIGGVQLGSNTLENFANHLRRETQPVLYVSVETHDVGGQKVVEVSVREPRPGDLYYAFGRPYVRVGKTNQVMSPTEQQARLMGRAATLPEEKDRPHFDFPPASTTNRRDIFELARQIRHVSGEMVSTIECRIRGPRLQPPMEWRQINTAHLGRTTLYGGFDKTQSVGYEGDLTEEQLGVEVRFHWRGKLRYELHRYVFVNWEVRDEVLPPLTRDE